jgi:DNA-3-methyladenine glycosylase II
VGQQLAGAAAETIWGRYAALFDASVSPEGTLRLRDARARGAGLSSAKWASLRALAKAELDGELRLRGLSRMDDDTVRERLIAVRGIGPWTANMFLIFHLMRTDIWPTGDLGVRYGFALARGLNTPPSAKELQAMGDEFRPYRSSLACYCWRALDASRA